MKPVINGYISHGFDEKREFNGKEIIHGGYDIGSKEQIPQIHLMYDSYIVARGWSDSYGWRVWAKVLSGELKGKFIVYAHMEKLYTNIQVGITFKEGEVIGIMGDTGYSKGRHLHVGCESSPDGKGIKIKIPELEVS